MNMKTLNDLFLDELADMYDAEKRIVKALPKLAKAATCTDLKAAIATHLKETRKLLTKKARLFRDKAQLTVKDPQEMSTNSRS
jgi:ferritin-like metal-binding protein YciE